MSGRKLCPSDFHLLQQHAPTVLPSLRSLQSVDPKRGVPPSTLLSILCRSAACTKVCSNLMTTIWRRPLIHVQLVTSIVNVSMLSKLSSTCLSVNSQRVWRLHSHKHKDHDALPSPGPTKDSVEIKTQLAQAFGLSPQRCRAASKCS